jgi:hypothetical protein
MKLLFPLSYVAGDDLTLEQLHGCNGMLCLCSTVVNLIHLPFVMLTLLCNVLANSRTRSDACKVFRVLCLTEATYQARIVFPSYMDDTYAQ